MAGGEIQVDMDALAIRKLGDSLRVERMRATEDSAFKAKRNAARGRRAKAASTCIAA
jgi:hypothetical protein